MADKKFIRHCSKMASFLSTRAKKKSRASGFFFLYFSLFSFHSSLFSKPLSRLFQRRDKREERKEKVAFLLIVKKQFVIKRIHDSSIPNKKWRKYLFCCQSRDLIRPPPVADKAPIVAEKPNSKGTYS